MNDILIVRPVRPTRLAAPQMIIFWTQKLKNGKTPFFSIELRILNLFIPLPTAKTSTSIQYIQSLAFFMELIYAV